MNNLNNIKQIKELDTENMLNAIGDLPNQIESAWKLAQNIKIPASYININKIVMCGMGGSGISADIVKMLAFKTSKIPFFVIKGYALPSFVDEQTLVIATSYSGDTEETLAAFSQAATLKAKLFAITTGGKLESLAKKLKSPIFTFSYAAQPRAALGYLLTPALYVCSKIGALEITDAKIQETITILKNYNLLWRPQNPELKNLAKQFAKKIYGFIPILWTNTLNEAIALRWKGSINENAKTQSFTDYFSELNHNSLVGVNYPQKLGQKIIIIFLKSSTDSDRITLREAITIRILQEHKIPFIEINLPDHKSILITILSSISLGDYISYYLAILNGVNPTPTPSIIYLKEQLDVKD